MDDANNNNEEVDSDENANLDYIKKIAKQQKTNTKIKERKEKKKNENRRS